MGGKPPDWFGRKTQNSATSQERLVENEMIRSGSGALAPRGSVGGNRGWKLLGVHLPGFSRALKAHPSCFCDVVPLSSCIEGWLLLGPLCTLAGYL